MGGQLCRIRTTTVVRDMDFALAGKDTDVSFKPTAGVKSY